MRDERSNREKRRRRRLKNQILAYLVLIIIIVLIGGAGYLGVKGVIRYVNNYNDKVDRVIQEAESGASVEQGSEADNTADQGSSVEYNEEGYMSPNDGDQFDSMIQNLLSGMTIEEMIAGMFIVSPESITGVETAVRAGDGTKTAITQNPVGGIIYKAKNFNASEQFAEMIGNTQSFSKYPLIMAVKAECGTADFGLAATAKATELTDTDSVKQAYGSIASALTGYGINMNLAPTAEFLSGGGDAVLLVNAAVQSMQEAGISAALQKFPCADAGSKSLEELKDSGFAIYDSAIKNGVDCIMVSHDQANGVTGDDTPSSLSSVMINDVLRNTLGFTGVVMTDYLDDSVITENYSSAEAAVAAIQAGADILLSPENYQEAYEGVLQAVTDGIITQERIHESIYRIYRVKYKNALK
ncbi:MAG: hypothetical protein K2M91_15020 [Lachnospiraceae bacterium]|nr:hypothetical protein [Lachnospiraceae bacterium]